MGKQDGKPVIYLHGGPGAGCEPDAAKFFDPSVYRIVLMSQRGSGKSRPHAELKENTTWDLVEDLERLRKYLGIDKWMVFGGSWGSTLSLCYAIKHPEVVKSLILRGIFTLRRKELLWFYQEGASFIFPDAYDKYVEPIPQGERDDLIGAYYRKLTGGDEEEMVRCARAWSTWEMSTCKLLQDPAKVKEKMESDDGRWAVAFARIECHFFVHGGWFDYDGWIMDNLDKIRHIPATVVHGRYDVVCPAKNAWDLHKRWPEAELHIIGNAGHSATEADIEAKLVEAADRYKEL